MESGKSGGYRGVREVSIIMDTVLDANEKKAKRHRGEEKEKEKKQKKKKKEKKKKDKVGSPNTRPSGSSV